MNDVRMKLAGRYFNCLKAYYRFSIVAFLLGALLLGKTSFAQNKIRVALPLAIPTRGQFVLQGGYSKQTGLRIEAVKQGFDLHGYAVFEIQVKAKAAASKDRKIEFTWNLYENSREDTSLAISKTIVLEANRQEATTTLLVPQLLKDKNNLLYYSCETKVDGKRDSQLSQSKSGRQGVTITNSNGLSSEGLQAIVPFALSQTSLIRTRLQQRPESRQGQRQYFSDNLYRYELKQNLTKNWLAYSSADVVKIDASLIEGAIKDQPIEWQAMMDWVATGGSLWIEETSNKTASLVKITEQLQLADWHFDMAEGVDIRKPPVEGWKYDSLLVKKSTNPRDARQEVLDSVNPQGLRETLRSLTKSPDTAGWYAWFPYGMGRVYAFTERVEDFPFSIDRDQRRSAFTKLQSQNWRARHGLVLGEKSPTFANLLIPGVGIAPVVEFQVLITLFVLLIGPLNYWILYRLNRLHLLVLTTPLFAGLVTASLLVYALFCDGFGVQARARTVTLLNQEKSEAVTWSRMTHYAGSAPKKGMQMPEDAAIYPILPGYESAIAGSKPKEREIIWEEGRQDLISGWLPSRTAVQHLAVRKGETNHRIDFLTANGSKLEISNQLGADIALLLVKDEDESWKVGYEILAGDKKTLEPIELSKATVDFRILTIENKPAMPDGAGKQAGEMLANFGSRQSSRDFGSANMEENLLNRYIERLSGIDGTTGLALPPKSYLAVTQSAVESPMGVSNIDESGSFHITVGKW